VNRALQSSCLKAGLGGWGIALLTAGAILGGSLLAPDQTFAESPQDPGQRIVPLDEDVYPYLRGMALEAGVLPPSSSVPFSIEELENELRRIRRNSLEAGTRGKAGTAAEEEVNRFIQKQPVYDEPGGFAFYPDLRIQAEAYLHTNRDYDTWGYGAEDRKPIMGILADAVFFHALDLYIDLTVQKDPFQAGGDPDNYTNILTSPYQFDLNIPYRAGASFGGEHWNVWLGRDKLSWGNGRTGNLLLSDADLYHEGLRFTTWWERFKFTFLLLGLESWQMETAPDGTPYPYETEPEPEQFKMFLAHRLEFPILPNLRLTVNESIVYGGKYPDLRVFNPLMIYHNLYLKEYTNSLMTLEMDYVPFPGLYVYAQYAQDQLSTIFEKDSYGTDEEPNAMGYLAGVEFQRGIGGGWLRIGYEFVKTDPWLYIRETPYVSFFSTRRVHSESRKEVLGEKNYYFLNTPLGYQYGPDAVVNSLRIVYEVPARYKMFIEYALIFKGENEVTTCFLTGDPAWALDTPSGTPDVQNWITLGGEYPVSRKFLVLIQTDFVYNGNEGHKKGRTALDFQVVFGLRYRPLNE